MPVLAVVPARLGSTRIPHKPLQLLAGKPLIVRVVERVQSMGAGYSVVVATDSERIASVVRETGVAVEMTSEHHASGTDRVVEVAGRPPWDQYEIVVNIQGDEPFLPASAVAGAVARVRSGDDIGTAAAPLAPSHAEDPSRVKVVLRQGGQALYFSRARIPFWRDAEPAPPGTWWQHLGVYAFRRDRLTAWPGLIPTSLEAAERLEQLRALEHGWTIGVALLDQPAEPGIDTPEDLHRAEARWHAQHGAV